MKSKVTFIPAIALLLSACTTGSYVTDRYDDVYYTPGATTPPRTEQLASSSTVSEDQSAQTTETAASVYTNTQNSNSGVSTTKNYILQSTDPDAAVSVYDLSNATLDKSDTTVLVNDSTTNYIVNNYYTSDDLSYADRINLFYNGIYDPYWDPWDSSYFGWGYYNPYFSWSIGFRYPYWRWASASNFYWDWWFWDYPFYSSYYYPYYRGYYGGHPHSSGYFSNRSGYYYGHRGSSASNVSRTGVQRNSTITRSAVHQNGTIERSSSGTLQRTGQSRASQTILEERRSSGSSTVRQSVRGSSNTNGIQRSSAVSTSGRRYIPSYTKPRTVTRSVYNQRINTGNTYYRGSSSTKNTTTNYRATYRSTYERGTSNQVIRRSYNSVASPTRSNTSVGSGTTNQPTTIQRSTGGGRSNTGGGGGGRRR